MAIGETGTLTLVDGLVLAPPYFSMNPFASTVEQHSAAECSGVKTDFLLYTFWHTSRGCRIGHSIDSCKDCTPADPRGSLCMPCVCVLLCLVLFEI
eukprot:1159085-Pelagomonas_calceolata.AAC.9